MTLPATAPRAHGQRSALSHAWRWLPIFTFVLLTFVSWRRWFLPFQDGGRELLTADLVAGGRTLYREVNYPYGPLPAYVDGAAFRLFGRDLDVLVALRVAVALLGVEALRRLTRRLCGNEAVAGAAAALAVAACCFRGGGNWPFPYSVAALEGTVGVWWALELALASTAPATSLLAAVVAGVAGGTKLELLPAALLAVGPALFLRRPRREAALAVALAATLGMAAFAIPVMLYGVETMRRYGFLVVFSVPESWNELYRTQVLFRGTSPGAFFTGGFLRAWGPSLLLFGALTAACRVRAPAAWRIAALVVLFAGTVYFVPAREELGVLVPGAAAVCLIEGITAMRRRELPRRRHLAAVCIALVAVVAAARQPFFLRNATYGAFTAPLAIATSLGWVARRTRFRQDFAIFLVALTGFHVADRFLARRAYAAAEFEGPGVHVILPAAEARFIATAAVAIERSTPENAYVACFPEAGPILFLTRRRHPFVDTIFYPGSQDAVAEDAMIRRLHEAPVAAVLVTNRPFPEYGPRTYGKGVLDRFFAVLNRDYQPLTIDGRRLPGGRATAGTLYLRR